jgi:hypothetical protein
MRPPSAIALHALAARLHGLSTGIDRQLLSENPDRHLIAAEAAAELARLTAELQAAVNLAAALGEA